MTGQNIPEHWNKNQQQVYFLKRHSSNSIVKNLSITVKCSGRKWTESGSEPELSDFKHSKDLTTFKIVNYVISLKVSKRFINNKNENMVLLNKFSVGSEFGSRIESLEKSDPVKKLVVSAALCTVVYRLIFTNISLQGHHPSQNKL